MHKILSRIFLLLVCNLARLSAAENEVAKPALVQPIAELKLTNGAVFRNVTVVRYEKERVVLKSTAGTGPLLYSYIPEPHRSLMVSERDALLANEERARVSSNIKAQATYNQKMEDEENERKRQKAYEEAADKRSIMIGMSEHQVIRAWGEPKRKNTSSSAYLDQWVYGSQYVYFKNGRVSSWSD